LQWITPREQDHVLVLKNTDAETYLIVAPGEKMLAETLERRRKLRSFDMAEHLEIPDENLIEFCQGQMLEGDKERNEFMWMIEWEF
jgi:hypothetical protein